MDPSVRSMGASSRLGSSVRSGPASSALSHAGNTRKDHPGISSNLVFERDSNSKDLVRKLTIFYELWGKTDKLSTVADFVKQMKV